MKELDFITVALTVYSFVTLAVPQEMVATRTNSSESSPKVITRFLSVSIVALV